MPERDVTILSQDDFGIAIERAAEALKDGDKIMRLSASVMIGMWVKEDGEGVDLDGSTLGPDVAVTVLLAHILHDHLHALGVSGASCMFLEAIEAEAKKAFFHPQQ